MPERNGKQSDWEKWHLEHASERDLMRRARVLGRKQRMGTTKYLAAKQQKQQRKAKRNVGK